jgi:PAS domain S-box-containing protein
MSLEIVEKKIWRLLIVDDSVDDRNELRRLLLKGSDRHYQFSEAETGAQCLSACLGNVEEVPDCVLLDYHLPDYDAPELLEALGGSERACCPILLVTGYSGPLSSAEVFQLGAQDFIGKDWLNPQSLTRAVENTIERFRLDRELKKSEARFRSVAENTQDVIVRMEVSTGRYEYVSPACQAVFGCSAEELLARDVEATLLKIHPDDREPVLAEVARIDQIGHGLINFRARTQGDTYRWLSASMSVLKDYSGAPVYRDAIIRDVTQNKQMEEALHRSEIRAKIAAESSAIGIWELDLLTGELFWDESMCALYGITPAEFSGTYEDWVKRMHPDDRDHNEALFQTALTESEHYVTEFRVIWPDASLHFINAHVHLLRDREHLPHRAIGSNWDVTESKCRENNLIFLNDLQTALAVLRFEADILQEAGKRIGQYLNLTHCSLVEIDEPHNTGTVLYDQASANAPRLQGIYTLSDFHSEAELRMMAAGAFLVVPDVHTSGRAAKQVQHYENCSICALINASYVADNKWKFVLHVSRDKPTQWSELDVELITQLAARLYPRIERARAEAALQQADRRKDEFLAMLGHELRNPLMPISTVAQAMSAQPLDAATQAWAVGILQRNVGHITRLVDDLLDVSRISRGLITLRRERVDFVSVIRESYQSVQGLAETKRQSFQLKLPSEPLYLDADPVRLNQIIINLLQNAVKYTQKEGNIVVTLSADGKTIDLRIRDNGIGMAADFVPQVFDLFLQAEQALNRAEGGLGIGLTLVKKLVDLHGGQITATSPGLHQGSEFCLQLPQWLDQTAAPEPSTGWAMNFQSAQNLRLLLIDDNPDILFSLSFLLQHAGYITETAADGLTGCALAQSKKPDVILVDIGLPGMNGYQVAQRLREELAGQPTLIIALIGYAQGDDSRAFEAGFDHYLTKPPDMVQLQSLIADYQKKVGIP